MNSLRLGLDDGPQRPKPSSNPGIWIRNNKPDHGKSANLPALTSLPWCYGAEFTGQLMDLWAYRNGVKIDFSRPGKPTDNAFCESFNGTFRAECLDTNWFASLPEAKQIIEAWRQDYNVSRPHRALADRTPAEFARQIAVNRDLSEPKTGQELTF